jgi:pimeloyl-ACP methyl ester carboxylesterase
LKKYGNGRFTESAMTEGDRRRMSVVFTHGWRSDPDVWAADMAAKMIASGLTEVNLLAWDWKQQAANPELGVALSSTPGQGEKLGQALAQSLGGSYGLPIHFIGHSLGTLVNAAAANYLHEQKSGTFQSSRTHLTLLDDAEVANIGGRLVTLGYTIPGVQHPLTALPSAAILGQVLSVGWVSPVPRERAWMDNYVSLAGQLHNEAVNTLLVQAPERVSPSSDIVQLHGYAARWYGLSVGDPAGSDMGFRFSFARLGTQAVFPSPSPYPMGTVFAQVEGDANELRLVRLQSGAEIAQTLGRNLQLVGLGVQRPADYAAGVAQTVGSAFVGLAMSFIPRPIEGTPVFSGTAMSTPAYFSTDDLLQSTPVWSLQFVLQASPSSPLRQQSLSAQGLRPLATAQTNQPSCVWVPVDVPTDAVVFCFDFTRSGEPKEDMFLASINGTNVFTLETRFMPPDTRLNSGPIDVSRWAGKTVELFFGFVGGIASDAALKVNGLRFYGIEEQRLAAELAGNAVIISWPAAMQGYLLEAADSLTGKIRWSVVPGSPRLIGSRFAVTNSITSASRFYRLRKQ